MKVHGAVRQDADYRSLKLPLAVKSELPDTQPTQVAGFMVEIRGSLSPHRGARWTLT
jgi:hypothetical protein